LKPASSPLTRRSFLAATAIAASALPLGLDNTSEAQAPHHTTPAANPNLDFTEPGPSFQMDFWCLPRVQFWSFNNRDPLLEAFGLTLSVQITTTGPDENTYSLHAGNLAHTLDPQQAVFRATALASAGQQQQIAGSCELRLQKHADRILVTATAAVDKEPVRAIKLILHHLPPGRIGFTSFESVRNLQPVPVESLALAYPTYQGGAPVWSLATDGPRGWTFSSLDVTTRPRRFVASPEPDGRTRIELIFEGDARHWSNTFTTPAWELRPNATLDDALSDRCALLERDAGLLPWDRRSDVPAWVHDISLVVTLHGMHWSGYIFQDYAAMRASVDWVTQRIPGKHVLFFLAGWEGRYYRTYGNSVPNPRLGGNQGFQSIIEAAHGKGAHVMAMYAGNAAMPGTPGFAEYAPGSHFEADNSLGWTPMRGYTVDWSTVRGSDTDGSAWLNPGAPGWQAHLSDQVRSTIRDFRIDGAFFDTQPNFGNDRRYDPAEGLRKIVTDLRSETANLMIATESWADLTYSFLHAGQTPAGYKNWSARYGRRFAHLAMAEPSRGSTGVHELGFCEYNFDQLMSVFDWPTLALVEDTLTKAPEKAARVIQYAKSRLPRG